MNKKIERFSIRKRIKSFSYALNGLKILFSEEHNSRIHLIAAIIAITMGFLLKISANEWFAVIFAIGMVISFELINSAIEKLADFVSPDLNKLIKKTKDMAAAAVLVSAISAVLIGFIVFLPKLILYVR